MSELKAYTIYEGDVGNYTEHVVYSKSEADEVITELEDKLKNVSDLLKETREWLVESQKLHKRCADNAVKVIAHSNYKRCWAMSQEWRNYAAFCGMQSSCHNHRGFGKTAEKWSWRETHAWRCVNRWIELAMKFELKNGVNNA